MSDLPPFSVLADRAQAESLPLPPTLATLYGPLALPVQPGRPYLYANFITTLDGVAAYDVPGKSGGGDIGTGNAHDRALMGLLRALADAIVVGAGTLRIVPDHAWTPAGIYRPLAEAYQALRQSLGRPRPPINVIVSASGDLDLKRGIFQSGEVPVLIVTTMEGAARLRRQQVYGGRTSSAGNSPVGRVAIAEVADAGSIPARSIVAAIQAAGPSERILVEGGPHLLGDFLAAGLLDEQFLTLAPQVAGRNGGADRLGVVAGHLFAPDAPLRVRLVSVREAGDSLFLRYAFVV